MKMKYTLKNPQKYKTTLSSVVSLLLKVAVVFFMFIEFGSWIGFMYFQLKISENLLGLLNKLASLHPFKC